MSKLLVRECLFHSIRITENKYIFYSRDLLQNENLLHSTRQGFFSNDIDFCIFTAIEKWFSEKIIMLLSLIAKISKSMTNHSVK